MMRALLLTVLLATVSPALTTESAAAHAGEAVHAGDAAQAGRAGKTVRLGGVSVRLRAGTRQVVTVNRRRGHHADVVLWERTRDRWRRRLAAHDGRIGWGGVVRPTRRVQGSGATPLGTYRLTSAFGTGRRRGADLPYRRIRPGDYWVLDNASPHYNRFRTRQQGGFRWWLPASHADASERLADYPLQYEFSVVTSFNAGQVRHRGGAIFLHVNGSGATAGCVSAPRWFLRRVVARLDAAAVPVITVGR